MATVSTEHIEIPPATGSRPKRSRWRVVMDLLIVPTCLFGAAVAVTDFFHGEYLKSINGINCAAVVSWSLCSLISGTNFERNMPKHPWLTVAFLLAISSGPMANLVTIKRENDQRRALAYQTRVQAAQPVKGTP